MRLRRSFHNALIGADVGLPVTGFVLGACLLIGTSCGETNSEKPETEKSSETTKANTTKEVNDALEWKDLEIPKLGLTANVPGNAKLDALGSISTSDWSCSLSLSKKASPEPSYENWVTNIEKGNKGGVLKAFVSQSKSSPDEWELHWTTENGKFGYAAHRKVGEVVVACTNFQSTTQEKHDCAAKICKSLRAP